MLGFQIISVILLVGTIVPSQATLGGLLGGDHRGDHATGDKGSLLALDAVVKLGVGSGGTAKKHTHDLGGSQYKDNCNSGGSTDTVGGATGTVLKGTKMVGGSTGSVGKSTDILEDSTGGDKKATGKYGSATGGAEKATKAVGGGTGSDGKISDAIEDTTGGSKKATGKDGGVTGGVKNPTKASGGATGPVGISTDTIEDSTGGHKKATDKDGGATGGDEKTTDTDRSATGCDEKTTDADGGTTDADGGTTDGYEKATDTTGSTAGGAREASQDCEDNDDDSDGRGSDHGTDVGGRNVGTSKTYCGKDWGRWFERYNGDENSIGDMVRYSVRDILKWNRLINIDICVGILVRLSLSIKYLLDCIIDGLGTVIWKALATIFHFAFCLVNGLFDSLFGSGYNAKICAHGWAPHYGLGPRLSQTQVIKLMDDRWNECNGYRKKLTGYKGDPGLIQVVIILIDSVLDSLKQCSKGVKINIVVGLLNNLLTLMSSLATHYGHDDGLLGHLLDIFGIFGKYGYKHNQIKKYSNNCHGGKGLSYIKHFYKN